MAKAKEQIENAVENSETSWEKRQINPDQKEKKKKTKKEKKEKKAKKETKERKDAKSSEADKSSTSNEERGGWVKGGDGQVNARRGGGMDCPVNTSIGGVTERCKQGGEEIKEAESRNNEQTSATNMEGKGMGSDQWIEQKAIKCFY